MQIKFKTALVTGSSRGLGRQIAVKLATEGVKKIAIHYRKGDRGRIDPRSYPSPGPTVSYTLMQA